MKKQTTGIKTLLFFCIIVTVAVLAARVNADGANKWKKAASESKGWINAATVTDAGYLYNIYKKPGDSKLLIKFFDGKSWKSVITPAASQGPLRGLSATVNNRQFFIAYNNGNDRLIVRQFNGTSWKTLGSNDVSKGKARYICLVINSGIPFVAYSDEGLDEKAVVKRFNGNSWDTLGKADISRGGASSLSMVFFKDQPWIAYNDKTFDKKAIVKRFNGKDWEQAGAGTLSEGRASNTSLLVNKDAVYALYNETVIDPSVEFPNNAHIRYAVVKTFSGNKWATVKKAKRYLPQKYLCSVAVHKGKIYAVYKYQVKKNNKKKTKIIVKLFIGNRWTTTLQPGFFSNGNPYNITFNFYKDTPYIAFSYSSGRGFPSEFTGTIMKYSVHKMTQEEYIKSQEEMKKALENLFK